MCDYIFYSTDGTILYYIYMYVNISKIAVFCFDGMK